MRGTIRWNAALGLIGFTATFLFSIARNPIVTTCVRGVYSFVVLFVIGFVFRWILGIILSDAAPQHQHVETAGLGKQVDLSTPEEDESIYAILREPSNSEPKASQFQPLQLPQLVTHLEPKTEQAVKAIRHLTEE